MEWYFLLPFALALLLFLLFTGMPIFIAFLALNLAGVFFFIGPRGSGLVINSIYEASTSSLLTAIPLYIIMGEILFKCGYVDVLFEAVGRLIGQVRGRLFYFVIALSTIFGAVAGSGIALTAMLSKTSLPIMERRGYNRQLSIGMIMGGACLAPIIPPSTLAVVIGSMADVSTAKLLVGGTLPGIIIAAIFTAYVAILLRFKPEYAPAEIEGQTITLSGVIRGVIDCLPFCFIMFAVMGLLMMGIATPAESAATGLVATLLTAAYYRKLNFQMIAESVMAAVSTTAMIMAILASSKLFTQLLSFTGAATGLVNTVTSMPFDATSVVIAMMAITFVMCMFIDQIAFMLIAIPIFQPLLKSFGIDPVWFWTLFLINLSVGSLTPPFGYNLFTMKAVAPWLSIGEIFRAAWIVVLLFVLSMALFVAFPSIITVLPDLM